MQKKRWADLFYTNIFESSSLVIHGGGMAFYSLGRGYDKVHKIPGAVPSLLVNMPARAPAFRVRMQEYPSSRSTCFI